MPVPVAQMWTVASYVARQKLTGRKRYPLVLMLEPLMRCNLACAGCGKIQYPAHVLKRQLTPEQCFAAAEECGAPMVSIPGGEPLMHPQIQQIVEGLVARKKYVYLCTNALLLKEKIDLFKPTRYLTFSVHMDGQREHHDFAVCREGTYDIAVEGIREAVKRGFRVTTNTTLFDGANPDSVRGFFDEMMDLGVEGMMLSPGYSYDKAPDQQHFLGKEKTTGLFRSILKNRKKSWRFNQSPLFLEFLAGSRHYSCTPWGMPTYNIFGWQKPCYLLQDGYAQSFKELMDATEWQNYGTESGNPKCANCMVHSGYEASSVDDTFSSFGGFFSTIRATLFPKKYRSADSVAPATPQPPAIKTVPLTISAASRFPAVQEAVQGLVPALETEGQRSAAFETAFDYRGDVTITLKNGQRIEGYAYDRRWFNGGSDGEAKLLINGSAQPVSVRIAEVERLEFTGRDTAAGKSFETWVRKYREKKAAGESNIGLHPEALE